MKKAVSIALFGSGELYAKHLYTYLLAHMNLFPIEEGWTLHVHIDSSIDEPYRKLLDAAQWNQLIVLREMPFAPLTRAMLWRMEPLFSSDADYVFCRDIDALPMPRDRRAMEQYMQMGVAEAHTIHDHLHHYGMMGGLCGFRSDRFKNVMGWSSLADISDQAMFTVEQWQRKGADQDVLNHFVAGNQNIKLLEHRYAGWTNAQPGSQTRPAGHYACQAWSTPLPDVGLSRLSAELNQKADELAPHLGSAGYDIVRARAFWEEHGDPAVLVELQRCAS